MSNNVFSKSPISSNSGANHGSTFESAITAVADDNSEENIKHKVKKVIKNHHSTKSDTDEDHYNRTTKMHETENNDDVSDFQENKKHILKKVNSKVTPNNKKNPVDKTQDFSSKKLAKKNENKINESNTDDDHYNIKSKNNKHLTNIGRKIPRSTRKEINYEEDRLDDISSDSGSDKKYSGVTN